MTPKQEKTIKALFETMKDSKLAPWQKPWKGSNVTRNGKSMKAYNGMNVWLTEAHNLQHGFNSPFFLTYKQAAEMGGHVLRGAKGCTVFFYKVSKYTIEVDGEEEEKSSMLSRAYTVFNVEQTTLSDDPRFTIPEVEEEVDPIKELEQMQKKFIADSGVKYSEGGARAFYSPSDDSIKIPTLKEHRSAIAYYSTFFHEAAHSTGHKSRLDRKLGSWFGTEPYAKEELIAEMAASLVLDKHGTDYESSQSAAYVKSWWKRLDSDPGLFWSAAQAAAKAADYMAN